MLIPVIKSVSTVPTTTISISLLPNSEDVEFLESLQDYIQKNGGYFNIAVTNRESLEAKVVTY